MIKYQRFKMLNNKKGIELSMNMIIITVLGLLVLLVLAFFIYKGVTKTNDALLCTNNNGQCYPSAQGCPEENPLPASQWTCSTGQKCCTKMGG